MHVKRLFHVLGIDRNLEDMTEIWESLRYSNESTNYNIIQVSALPSKVAADKDEYNPEDRTGSFH